MSEDPELAKRLKQARTDVGLSAAMVAAAIDVTPQSISAWERKGRGHSPSEAKIRALAELYGRSAAWLRYGEDEPLGPPKTLEEHRDREQLQIAKRYWLALSQFVNRMGEHLDAVDVGPNASSTEALAMLRVYREFRHRVQTLNRLAHYWYETYLWTEEGEAKLVQFRRICALNDVVFAQQFLPANERVQLSDKDFRDWPAQLGVSGLEIDEIQIRQGSGLIAWRDRESGLLLCTFDGALLERADPAA